MPFDGSVYCHDFATTLLGDCTLRVRVRDTHQCESVPCCARRAPMPYDSSATLVEADSPTLTKDNYFHATDDPSLPHCTYRILSGGGCVISSTWISGTGFPQTCTIHAAPPPTSFSLISPSSRAFEEEVQHLTTPRLGLQVHMLTMTRTSVEEDPYAPKEIGQALVPKPHPKPRICRPNAPQPLAGKAQHIYVSHSFKHSANTSVDTQTTIDLGDISEAPEDIPRPKVLRSVERVRKEERRRQRRRERRMTTPAGNWEKKQ
ncbi:hypothetical protein CYLTODRAFT_213231 [Cylindrobasidium torrendii FP15055 ss-10]|uniref:Uncharacterized protein n=1 Tax=Cylindrobasidium torrendii FP15055 ss-10 TaxID=1314674 RepID=A0A0D7BJM2_9AGAR|nr:hypothetical protein CYLTODRAFT_213231 [Cylindrobasidium torrendii FP15055 ss-10]